MPEEVMGRYLEGKGGGGEDSRPPLINVAGFGLGDRACDIL